MGSLPQTLWSARVPLHITHASHPTTPPFITAVPRFSYLALLIPRLSAFYSTPCEGFRCEGVELRNLWVGLLRDLYGGGEDGAVTTTGPWRVEVGEGEGWDIGDTFLNCVKEADFTRNGNANQIMKMSKDHTTQLWNAVKDNNYAAFAPVQARLLNAPTALRNVPVRVYIPVPPPVPTTAETQPGMSSLAAGSGGHGGAAAEASLGSYRVMQTLVSPKTGDGAAKTLGEALREMLPGLFGEGLEGRVDVVMHGGEVPMGAPLGELMREAAFPDGWLCLVVRVV